MREVGSTTVNQCPEGRAHSRHACRCLPKSCGQLRSKSPLLGRLEASGRIRPILARFWTELDQARRRWARNRPSLGRCRPKLARTRAILGQSRTKLGQTWPGICQFGDDFERSRRPELGRIRADFTASGAAERTFFSERSLISNIGGSGTHGVVECASYSVRVAMVVWCSCEQYSLRRRDGCVVHSGGSLLARPASGGAWRRGDARECVGFGR